MRTDVSLPTSEEMVKTERGQFHQKQNLASVQAENDGIGVWIELFLFRQLAHMLILDYLPLPISILRLIEWYRQQQMLM